MVDRRELLTVSAAALGLAMIGALATAAALATPGAVELAARLRGPALLEALVRMSGRTDGRLVHGWLRSQRSVVIDGEVTPLCGVVAGAIQRCERLSESVYEMTDLEVAHYTDPVTRELLREWMIWQARASDLERSGLASVPADYAYTALTSWRPWMQMGEVSGHTLDSGYGAKAASWSDCPAEFLEMTRRLHPDVLEDPERALRLPPAMLGAAHPRRDTRRTIRRSDDGTAA